MNWNADKSVRLSQACVIVFAALLLALDIGCYWAVQWFTGLRQMSKQSAFLMMLTIYLCSIFAWILLVQLWRLLRNIQAGRIFDEDNVHLLRAVSWCCVGGADLPGQHGLLFSLRSRRHCSVLHGADRAHRQERVPTGHRHEV